MKNHIKNSVGVFYYSTTQQIKRWGNLSYGHHPLKIKVMKTRTGSAGEGYLVEIRDILSGNIVESIESLRLERDNEKQTNFFGTTDNRQVVIFWDSTIFVGLASTNVSGHDLLVNIFHDEGDDFLEPSPENTLEFLNSSAQFVKEYRKHDIWCKMRYYMIQYLMKVAPQVISRVTFVSAAEKLASGERLDMEELKQTLSQIEELCDVNAARISQCARTSNAKEQDIAKQNLALLSAVYQTILELY